MTEEVKNAFLLEKKMQDLAGIQSKVTIDGYHNFIFVNRFGNVQNQGTLNRALRRIIRDCNDKQLLKEKNNPVLLPNFFLPLTQTYVYNTLGRSRSKY